MAGEAEHCPGRPGHSPWGTWPLCGHRPAPYPVCCFCPKQRKPTWTRASRGRDALAHGLRRPFRAAVTRVTGSHPLHVVCATATPSFCPSGHPLPAPMSPSPRRPQSLRGSHPHSTPFPFPGSCPQGPLGALSWCAGAPGGGLPSAQPPGSHTETLAPLAHPGASSRGSRTTRPTQYRMGPHPLTSARTPPPPQPCVLGRRGTRPTPLSVALGVLSLEEAGQVPS